MIKHFLRAVSDFTRFFVVYMPGSSGRKLRYGYYRKKFKSCGKNVIIDEGVLIHNPESITIGENVWIDRYCILIAGKVNLQGKIVKRRKNREFKWEEGELIIESNVHIAPFCLIQAHGGAYIGQNCALSSGVKVYSLSNMPRNPYNLDETVYFSPMANNSAYFIGPVMLKENVGIALNCIILPGVMIGENSFATPNSVLLSSITPNSYVSGNPAKRVKERFKAAVRNE